MVVALYLGLEILTHLDGDRGPALELFDRATQLAIRSQTLAGVRAATTPAGAS
jgi:hypothetical protein